MNLLRFLESGIYLRDKAKAKSSMFDWRGCYKGRGYKTPLSLEHLNAAFYSLGLGLSLATFIFIYEMFHRNCFKLFQKL